MGGGIIDATSLNFNTLQQSRVDGNTMTYTDTVLALGACTIKNRINTYMIGGLIE